MQNKAAWLKHLFPAVILEFAHRGNTAFTVETVIRNSKENVTVLKREEYILCHYRLLLSVALGKQHNGS